MASAWLGPSFTDVHVPAVATVPSTQSMDICGFGGTAGARLGARLAHGVVVYLEASYAQLLHDQCVREGVDVVTSGPRPSLGAAGPGAFVRLPWRLPWRLPGRSFVGGSLLVSWFSAPTRAAWLVNVGGFMVHLEAGYALPLSKRWDLSVALEPYLGWVARHDVGWSLGLGVGVTYEWP
jgi:hypothetical protein